MKLRSVLFLLAIGILLSGCCRCHHHRHCFKPPSKPLPAERPWREG